MSDDLKGRAATVQANGMTASDIRTADSLISNARFAPWATGVPRGVGPRIARRLVVAAVVCVAVPLAAQTTVDHQRFDTLLRQHVEKGFVDYDAFARAPEFARYLASLDSVRPALLDEDERLAFWINVYNAFTIQLIISHRESESIRNINKALGVFQLKGPWSEPIVHAAGRRLTLDDVNHGIIRKEFGEPRIHFALVCAAMGCPPLRREAYTGARLVDQLNDQGRVFLRESPTRNRLMQRNRFGIMLSPILMAYRSDFGPTDKDLARALTPWFEGKERDLLMKERMFFGQTTFDWTLNSQRQAKKLGLM